MNLAVEEFLARLSDSGLATVEEIQSWMATIPDDARPKNGDELGRTLVLRHLLTEFQSQTIVETGEHPLVLGQYVLLDRIGQGGTGTVYKAMHRHMRREVAIKVLHAELAESPEALRRFQREILAGGKLNHPFVVPTLDANQQGETLFLVMEYVSGTDLATLVNNQGPLSVGQATLAVAQAAEGLAHAHEQGVVHRDIKPSNLMRDQRGIVRVLDLGLARFTAGEGHTELTGTGDVMGTADYMAPEQALDSRQADARVDIYSLGCTLFFLLTGRPPFGGETLMTRLLAHRDSSVPSVRSVRPDVPASLEAVVSKMLAKQPAERYQNMREVVIALQPFEGWQPIRSRWRTRRNAILAVAFVLLAAAIPISQRARWFDTDTSDRKSSSVAEKATGGVLRQPAPEELGGNVTQPKKPAPRTADAPFDARQAVIHQDEWASHLGIPVEIENSVGMKLRLIPPGQFIQGAGEQEIADAVAACQRAFDADGPQHRVQLTRPFYMGVYEVTQAEYESVIGQNPSQHSAAGSRAAAVAGLDTRRFPVESVSWFDAVDFCNGLSAREKRGPCYQRTDTEVTLIASDGYRLPTEAEWEFACRAGTDTPWSCDAQLDAIEGLAWFASNCGMRAQSVGLLLPNSFRLYDLHGNLWEWCQDYFNPRDYESQAGQLIVDPTGPSEGSPRSMRGGVWDNTHWLGRSAHRGANTPTAQNASIGFRVVLTIP